MKLFSERYNYTKVSDVIIRERITPEIQNAICSCFDRLPMMFQNNSYSYQEYIEFEKFLWIYFLNKRERDFSVGGRFIIVSTNFVEDPHNLWYTKLDLVELSVKYLYGLPNKKVFYAFVKELNFEFNRLNFAYRVVDKEIIEITAKEEMSAIESAMQNSTSNIRIHLNNALELYAQRPQGDYRNSIKESISAVEAYCREITQENTLGQALNSLNRKGVVLPTTLKSAFDKLYAYTNQPDTGIRHALMDDEGSYTPSSEEALFMLISCSAFINYLKSKVNNGRVERI